MRTAVVCLILVFLASCNQGDRAHATAGRRSIRVGRNRLEVLVEGVDRGRPTVILESGLGGGIDDWAAVRQSLSQVTRVVSYHRAGIAGSQPGPRPRSAMQIVSELRAMLQAAELDPPYVLVGHSIGGLYVRTYAGLHPEEVHGVVLVDPTMEFRQSFTSAEVEAQLQTHWGADYEQVQRLFGRIHPKTAALAARSMLELESYLEQAPISQRAETRQAWLTRFTDRAQRIEGMLGLMSDAERQELFACLESMRAVREFPVDAVPVTLLIAGKASSDGGERTGASDPSRSADYIAWAQDVRLKRFSQFVESLPHGTIRILDDAGHDIPNDRPDAIVDAVADLIVPPTPKP